ncbi:DUF6397 family protein [Streptomyces sp. 796.1]|uniref:DUF6397 family protein n=1 Tax=Streptomyces sp. 796.1 TaxID=3163029 RepID=UPI0039C947F0
MTVRAWGGDATAFGATVSIGSAARELGWQRKELDLAVQLGEVRSVGAGETVPWRRPARDDHRSGPALPGASWRRRVSRAEVDLLVADPCAAEALRGRLRLVGTAEAADVLSISPGRFTRLARAGCVCPVRFSINRYHAVVWWYLAVELVAYAAAEPEVSAPRLPERLRVLLRTEADWRGRNWRVRRVGQLLAQSADPWSRAAVSAAVLGDEALSEAVPDPAERAYLRELDPPLSPVQPKAAGLREVVDRVTTADGRDEVIWHQIGLTTALEDVRMTRKVPAAPPPATHPPAHQIPGRQGPHPTAATLAPRAELADRAAATGVARLSGVANPPEVAATARDTRRESPRTSPVHPHPAAATPQGPPRQATPQALPGSVWEWLTRTAVARRAREAPPVPRGPRTRARPGHGERRPSGVSRPPGRRPS